MPLNEFHHGYSKYSYYPNLKQSVQQQELNKFHACVCKCWHSLKSFQQKSLDCQMFLTHLMSLCVYEVAATKMLKKYKYRFNNSTQVGLAQVSEGASQTAGGVSLKDCSVLFTREILSITLSQATNSFGIILRKVLQKYFCNYGPKPNYYFKVRRRIRTIMK